MIDLFAERPERPAGDILSRVIRIAIGGRQYELPVRSIKANREWKALLSARLAALLTALDSSNDLAPIVELLSGQVDTLIDVLLAYDSAGVLPTKAEIEDIEPDPSIEIAYAVREVWHAANPFLAATVATSTDPETSEASTSGSSAPTSSPPPSGASARRRSSRKH